jgi:hypothetical protein
MFAALRRLPWLGAVLLALSACHGPANYTKPPLHEQYTLPPSDDARFSSPPAYPKETLDTNNFQKDGSKQNDPNKQPERFGAGPSGGMGMGRGY